MMGISQIFPSKTLETIMLCGLHSKKNRVLKQYPSGTISTNGTLLSKGHSFFLIIMLMGKKSAPEQKGAA